MARETTGGSEVEKSQGKRKDEDIVFGTELTLTRRRDVAAVHHLHCVSIASVGRGRDEGSGGGSRR